MTVVIDYGMGNLHSVSKALEVVGAKAVVTRDPQRLREAERIVLPGVGAFAQGMRHLKELNLIEALKEEVLVKKKPFLGICLGMQLTARMGEEGGPCDGLGWIDANVRRFDFDSKEFKVPHMGWNDVGFVRESPLFKGLRSPTTFYFVHSYHVVPQSHDCVVGVCEHGVVFAAAIGLENIHLVQFHPEKSQNNGLQVMENFLGL